MEERWDDGWDWLGIVIGVIALVLVCLPPKYDPAIRLKEWLNGLRGEEQNPRR